ncbi:Apulose-4-phosphate transketolase subunit A [subsurface metagenome]
MSAAHYQLDNLIAIIDHNGLQSGGKVESIMNLTPLDEKWKSFGWHVQEVNGHNIGKLIEAVESARETKGRPSLIIACTIKGKGVSFMENNYMWHARIPSAEEEKKALKELTEGMKKI